MSRKDCIKFGHAIGNIPTCGGHWEVWKQISSQALLIAEECQEMQDAMEAQDITEMMDAVMDIKFLNTYLEYLLECYGCNVKGAWESVCANNLGKTTPSYTYAQMSLDKLEEAGTECYIDCIVFEGETVYTVKRKSDSKVMKLMNHVRPDLEKFVPEELK